MAFCFWTFHLRRYFGFLDRAVEFLTQQKQRFGILFEAIFSWSKNTSLDFRSSLGFALRKFSCDLIASLVLWGGLVATDHHPAVVQSPGTVPFHLLIPLAYIQHPRRRDKYAVTSVCMFRHFYSKKNRCSYLPAKSFFVMLSRYSNSLYFRQISTSPSFESNDFPIW